MTDLWSREWVFWLAGLFFGALIGLAFWVVGIFAVVIALAAMAMTILGRWSLAFLSGWITGIGALWMGLMVRSDLLCSADSTCLGSAGTEGFVRVSLGILMVGVVLGIVAWRRQRRSWVPSA